MAKWIHKAKPSNWILDTDFLNLLKCSLYGAYIRCMVFIQLFGMDSLLMLIGV